MAARAPRPLQPLTDLNPFSALPQGAQDTLIDQFLRWTFGRPDFPKATRPLQQGDWLPVQPKSNAGEHPLAEGGQGIVHLWGCVDASHHIIDRVIVKEVVPGLANWNRPALWHNGAVGGEPREHITSDDLFTQLETTNAGDGKFMTECLGYGDLGGPYGNDPQGRPLLSQGQPGPVDIARYKLYFEYCPYGELYDLIERHRMADKPFHEGFIWMVFEALAKCAEAMERSNMVHGDMSTSNVLLGSHDPQRFKIWPVPKLSDFGASRYLDANAIARVGALGEAMQPDFASPELSKSGGGWEVPNLTLSEKTNVWNVGLIICCLMRLESVLPETKWRFMNQRDCPRPRTQQLRFATPAQRELPFPVRFQHRQASYSTALKRLVRDCMRYDPANRPTPSNLLQDVQAEMATRLDDLDTYTGGPTGRISWNKKERVIGKVTDMWSIRTKADFIRS